jgi:formylmethanofuran dehydrogenase subunit E
MSMVFECVVCDEWFRTEKEVYQEDNGDCICVPCWEDNVEELMEKYYGRSSRAVQQN